MLKYTVRYESDGQVTRIHFTPFTEAPTAQQIVTEAAGLLFLHDCCPGEDFCVYEGDDRSKPVGIRVDGPGRWVSRGMHRYYGDSDDLWPSDETEIMDL